MSSLDNLKNDRLEKLKKIYEKGINPYPSSYDKKNSIKECRESEGKTIKTAGKIFSLRTHGNIAFADLKDETGKIQIFFKKDLLAESYKQIELLDIGDYLGVEGQVVKTVAGEISIAPKKFTLLAKSLLPLPHQWFGLKDIEIRFRQRYLDLLINPEVRNKFNVRTKLVSAIRQYLDNLGFWEVETPVLQPLYGGANAKPFVTHFKALGQKMYLRIAPELYLKRLIAGGYERVYEIAKDFRNEGIDRSHNPEFTMIEWYEAYADYQRVMDVTEGLFKYLAKELYGNTKMKIEDKTIDIGEKWPRIEMTKVIKQKLGLDVETMTEKELIEFCRKEKIDILGGETKGQLIFLIFEHKIPQTLIEPTWIIDYPEDVSPLCKNHRTKKGWVERFEGYVGGKEICDGWSELTDPIIQRQRFINDVKAVRKDREEAQQVDENFIESMEYGLPPLGGIGIGIDRLTMFFTNTWAIKEVILFPTLKNLESKNSTPNPLPSTVKKNNLISREKVLEILNKNIKNKNLVKHCLAVETTMHGLAKYFNEDENKYGIVGLSHDADWEQTEKDHKLHGKKSVEWLRQAGETNQEIIDAVVSHNYTYNGGTSPSSKMAWSLYCCDDLTGLIVACALVMPNKKLSEVTVETVIKKMGSKSFAAAVNRDQIKLCQEKLGIKLEDFIGIVLKSMQSIFQQLGL